MLHILCTFVANWVLAGMSTHQGAKEGLPGCGMRPISAAVADKVESPGITRCWVSHLAARPAPPHTSPPAHCQIMFIIIVVSHVMAVPDSANNLSYANTNTANKDITNRQDVKSDESESKLSIEHKPNLNNSTHSVLWFATCHLSPRSLAWPPIIPCVYLAV